MSEVSFELSGSFPFIINFAYRDEKKFSNKDNLLVWVSDEAGRWLSVYKEINNDKFSSYVIFDLMKFFNGLEKSIRTSQDDTLSGEALKSIEKLVSGEKPTSNDSIGRLALSYLDRDSTMVGAVISTCKKDWNVETNFSSELPQIIGAISKANLIIHGWDKEYYESNIKDFKDKLEKYESKFEEKIIDYDNNYNNKIKDIELKFKNMDEELNKIIDRTSKLSESVLNKISLDAKNYKTTLSDHRKEFQAITAAHLEEMRLKAPAVYWSEQANIHSIASYCGWGIFFSIIAGIFFLMFDGKQNIINFLREVGGENFNPIGLIVVSLPSVLILWVLRQLSVFANTRRQLADDSRSREIMTTTYLALVAEPDSGMSDQDRMLVLNALFRPMTTSAQTETMPPSMVGVLQEVVKKDGR